MNKYFLFVVLLVAMSSAWAQVPQFSSSSFSGWIYNNPVIYLNEDNILANRVVLYKTSAGQDLTLTSPEFNCSAGKSIDMNVTWITTQWKDEQFDKSKVALTAALLDASGAVVDSVTHEFDSISRTNHVIFSLEVPATMQHARLRLASWKADVNSSGAVRQMTASTTLIGDVNLDGEISVADVNAVLFVILGIGPDMTNGRADVNHDGEVGLADVNRIIGFILN